MSEFKNEIEKKEKVENPEGTLTLNEALVILNGKSNIEKMGLRIAAMRDGFRSPHTGHGKEKFLIDSVKFQKWVKSSFDIDQNYKRVSFIARELNISTAYVYDIIIKYKIKVKRSGGGKGSAYVDFEVFKNRFNMIRRRKKG